jgi:transcriptional regulator GlxA family with amidase domain
MARNNNKKQVVLVVYPGFSLLELVGAQHVWRTAAMLSSFKVTVVGPTTVAEPATVAGSATNFIPSNTSLAFKPQLSLEEAPEADVLIVIGGGEAALQATEDRALLDYVYQASERAPIVGATSTGSLILGAAGLLRGRKATTHWAFRIELEALGAIYQHDHWVQDAKFITGAGSSSAIDMSLLLVERLSNEKVARQVQIGAEWDPAPPFGGIDWARVHGNGPPAMRPTGQSIATKSIALVIYPGLTVFDLVGPLELMTALSLLRPDFAPVVVAERVEPITSDAGLTFMPNRPFDEVPAPHVLIVPGGGTPTLRAMSNQALRDYIRNADRTTAFTTSVCTGALLLGSLGMLQGHGATTHWAYHRYLPAYGAHYLRERWVKSGRIINSAGVSAGIDMALYLIAQLTDEETARRVQLAIHYDPHPPFGGIDYDRLPGVMRALRAVTSFQVPFYVRKPRQLMARGL